MAKKVTKQAQAQEVKQSGKAIKVKALDLLKGLNLAWVLDRGLEDGDISLLDAKVYATDNGTEWASWITPYHRVDGNPVPGYSWGVSAPLGGRILILRLLGGGRVLATLKVWPNGSGLLTGEEPITKALLARPDLREWSLEDDASLL
jgi:hypothetical protein